MDLYTKAVLTVISIGIGLLVFQERPLRDAQAQSFTGNDALFASLSHARAVLTAWKHDYNHHRPHSAHGGLPPVEFAEKAGMGHAPYRLEQPARTGQHFETGLSQ